MRAADTAAAGAAVAAASDRELRRKEDSLPELNRDTKDNQTTVALNRVEPMATKAVAAATAGTAAGAADGIPSLTHNLFR